jgi:hypothetical protein
MSAMHLREAGSAATVLADLIGSDTWFSAVFVVADGVVRLKPDVEKAEAVQVAAEAAKLFQPPRFTTRREETTPERESGES